MSCVSRPLALGIIALALNLPGCGPPPTAVSDRASSPQVVMTPSSATSSRHASANASVATSLGTPSDQADAAEADWLAAAREDTDPSVRRHALELWAQRPSESLDPVTYALVDADESVRARAQELLEKELVRR